MVTNEASVGILIRKLKHGLERLPISNGNMSQSHMLVVGLLGAGIGAAGLLLGLKDIKMGNLLISWTSECKGTYKTSYYMAGLQNLGNNCFFNVVLQALASCGCFFSYLEDMLNTVDLEYKEAAEEMPLAAALVSVLNGLCIIHNEAVVLNPRKVMLAMSLYLTNFNLTRQQDAAEAFLHLMSSLEEELLECYTPCHGSLADITAFPGNVVSLTSKNLEDLRQWQKLRFGPFDGIIGSMLICANCSLQLSIDFEMFRCLALSPILEDYSAIMDDCTVIDCLRKLTAMECLESHHCGRCWHDSALKYLSCNVEENADKIKIIGSCFKQDSCGCAKFLHPEVNRFCGSSQTIKQLTIAHCPKQKETSALPTRISKKKRVNIYGRDHIIEGPNPSVDMVLCLHLQRASVSYHGGIIKLKDHVSFPLVLDLFPFTIAAKTETPANIEIHHDTMPFMQQVLHHHMSHSAGSLEVQRAQYVNTNVKQQSQLLGFSGKNLELPSYSLSVDVSVPAIRGDSHNDGNGFTAARAVSTDSSVIRSFTPSEHSLQDGKAYENMRSLNSKSFKYHLVSVVEHYGKPGSGHYAVYKKLSHPKVGESLLKFGNLDQVWFYISDSEVSRVTTEEVLLAEASLLFYEKIYC